MSKADSTPLPDLADLPGEATPAKGLLLGVEVIRDHLRRLPGKPGVYRMIGAEGEVLYVGKAKNLKNRVTSYARGLGHSNRIARMIDLTRAMEFVVTATETEALLLEANLIKRLRPRFNILMRDDKSLYLDPSRSCSTANCQASRCTCQERRLLWPLCERLGRQRQPYNVAKGISAALLHRQRL